MAIVVYKDYAGGLFVWLPIVLGILSTLLYGRNSIPTKAKLRRAALETLLVFSCGLVLFAFDGVICIVMAVPIGWLFTWVGYRIGYDILKKRNGNPSYSAMVLLIVSVPFFMAFEHRHLDFNGLRSVTTSVDIDASLDEVWRNVVTFPQLDEPHEFIFRTGIAYPINATIDGTGIGAIRHCNFTTGCFIEPITVWDENKMLNFSVLDQPDPMKELSPYNIHPNHLHGYWVSRRGSFKLTPLANGHTLLEGTTWYENKIRPDFYWTIWSDYIVHSIHLRVLQHIKKLAEKKYII